MTYIDSQAPVKFKIELEFEYGQFVIPYNKPRYVVNQMQREQAQWALEDVLKIAGFNPVTVKIHKVRA